MEDMTQNIEFFITDFDLKEYLGMTHYEKRYFQTHY